LGLLAFRGILFPVLITPGHPEGPPPQDTLSSIPIIKRMSLIFFTSAYEYNCGIQALCACDTDVHIEISYPHSYLLYFGIDVSQQREDHNPEASAYTHY